MFDEQRPRWLSIAEALAPELHSRVTQPQAHVRLVAESDAFQGWAAPVVGPWRGHEPTTLEPGETLTVDFGVHTVGRLQLQADRLTRLQVRFAEVPAELGDDRQAFPGKLGGEWLEPVELAVGSAEPTVHQARRAFRYVQLTLPDGAAPVRMTRVEAQEQCAVSASTFNAACAHASLDNEAQALDEVSLRTLRNCMHGVFEDGPKRDRRLWLGDLWLQARVNYVSFRDFALVKRCLYLFAACCYDTGMVPACVFEKPTWHHGTEFIPDYALIYGAVLHDYANASGDWDTVRDLWPVALHQAELVSRYTDEHGVFRDPGDVWMHVDWQPELDRQAPLQGVCVYALRRLVRLGEALDVEDRELVPLRERMHHMSTAARARLYDKQSGLYLSGEKRQGSWAGQVWMVLSGIAGPEQGRALFEVLDHCGEAVEPVTPYFHHFVVEALLACGLHERATEHLRGYWGSMIEKGATTFWEMYDPHHDRLSPYGSHLHNSYCHAWSCTPSLFVRQGLLQRTEAGRA